MQPTLSPFILLHSGGVMRQPRRHHRYLSLPLLFFFSSSCLSFISTPVLACIHLPCLFICTISLLITSFFFISHQMISETSLIPSPTPSSFPPISLALFLIVCLSFTLSFLCSSGCVFSFYASLLFLYSCHLTCLFFPSSDLSVLPNLFLFSSF